jgi:hypothetical protein
MSENIPIIEDPGWTEGYLGLVMAGNEFAVLSFLHHAQFHLMGKDSGIPRTLTVSLDGDYMAILKLQSAEGNVMVDAIAKAVKSGRSTGCAERTHRRRRHKKFSWKGRTECQTVAAAQR